MSNFRYDHVNISLDYSRNTENKIGLDCKLNKVKHQKQGLLESVLSTLWDILLLEVAPWKYRLQ